MEIEYFNEIVNEYWKKFNFRQIYRERIKVFEFKIFQYCHLFQSMEYSENLGEI